MNCAMVDAIAPRGLLVPVESKVNVFDFRKWTR
jgi:hypothetical protein